MQTSIPADTLIHEADASRARQLASRGDKALAARKVAREFEAMFVGMMLKSMRETVGKDPLTGGGRGEEIFRSMLDQEYASAIAAGGGIGLASVIEKQLLGEQSPGGVDRSERGDAPMEGGADQGREKENDQGGSRWDTP